MRVVTLQPAPRTDQITEDGTELTQLPYPFHVHEDGTIDRQDFWSGYPLEVVGFADRLDVQQVDLWWSDAWRDPQQAIGKYVVTRDKDGEMGTYLSAIASVEVTEVSGA